MLYIAIDVVFAVVALLGLALVLASLAIYDWLSAPRFQRVRWMMQKPQEMSKRMNNILAAIVIWTIIIATTAAMTIIIVQRDRKADEVLK